MSSIDPDAPPATLMLFRLAVPCRVITAEIVSKARRQTGKANQSNDHATAILGSFLDESYRLPNACELVGQFAFADIRIGWLADGLAICLRVGGKHQPPYCRPTHMLASDGIQLWIDTRDTHNVHRATRFCHWFVMMPCMSQHDSRPMSSMLRINRAKEDPRTLNQYPVPIASEVRADSYMLSAWIPGKLLTGWDPAEHPRLGFCYAVQDQQWGLQTFGCSPELPFREDPTLWHTLRLMSDGGKLSG